MITLGRLGVVVLHYMRSGTAPPWWEPEKLNVSCIYIIIIYFSHGQISCMTWGWGSYKSAGGIFLIGWYEKIL